MSIFRNLLIASQTTPTVEIPQWFKDSIVCWYCPRKQESITEILKDFSGNNNDMNIHNTTVKGDALVFNGTTSYGVVFNVNIDQDYTIACKRKWLSCSKSGCLASKIDGLGKFPGAFQFERKSLRNTVSYNFPTPVLIEEDGFSFQSKNLYNGKNININPQYIYDSNGLVLGRRWTDKDADYAGFELYDFMLFNRTLTTEEIDWIKTNLIKTNLI